MKAYTQQKDFRKDPHAFCTDSGEEFRVEVLKRNIRTVWLRLIGPEKVIKVRRKSHKLVY